MTLIDVLSGLIEVLLLVARLPLSYLVAILGFFWRPLKDVSKDVVLVVGCVDFCFVFPPLWYL